ncbi:outer membrane beta-barrel protein [Rhodocytophaga aerolata]|uniref:Outer membrane beta-barrel protein n=1 Tax=Rhodocytophaga aerolata TaxID=455078 RepID=A0ABT8RH86_9BACT|nr:outer membrane beta-barrel protein [Rhodocytophaga aerolata]MDO1451472.1 outer membrane beta-barrel protein [Rhodocytophaga aerolata]
MLKSLLSFLLISILLLSPLYGQSDFRDGYIVTHNGDTLRGFVDNRTETKNARQVGFKSTLSGEVTKYDPTTINAYGLTGDKMYEAKTIPVDSTSTQKAFVELLVKGKISLYRFKNDGSLYIEKDAKPLQALYQTDIKVYRNGLPYIQIRKNYIGTLQWYMSDCSQIQKKIDHAKLDYLSLMKIVDAYNHCGQEKGSLRTKRKFIVISAGAVGGLQVSKMHSSTEGRGLVEYINHAQFGYSLQPSGGVFIKTNFPWITTKISLYAEGQYTKAHYSSNYVWTMPNAVVNYREELAYTLSYLRIPVLLRYTFPRGRIKPFVQAGGTFDFILSQSSRHISEQEWTNTKTVYTFENKPASFNPSFFYGTIGTGLEFSLSKKLWGFIELRGAYGATATVAKSAEKINTTFQILSLQTGIGF